MIVLVGDVHAEFVRMAHALQHVPLDATIIQVGDFGFWPNRLSHWMHCYKMPKFEKPVYFIDGNHEYYPDLPKTGKPTEVWPGLVHVPRGTVLELEGLQVGFLGGGTSIDKAFRKEGVDWFADERISAEELARFDNVDTLDLLVTHTPPTEVIRRNFDSRIPIAFGLPSGFIDPESKHIEALWKRLGRPQLVCGHMHRSVVDGPVRILEICETCTIGEPHELSNL